MVLGKGSESMIGKNPQKNSKFALDGRCADPIIVLAYCYNYNGHTARSVHMMDTFVLDRQAAVPIYEQIAEHIGGEIERGGVKPGMRLPPVRTLMEQYATTNHTIQRAMRELEGRGFVKGKPGSGVYVTYPGACADRESNELRMASIDEAGLRSDAPKLFNEFQRRISGGRIVETSENPDIIGLLGGEVEKHADELADIGEYIQEVFGYSPDEPDIYGPLQLQGRSLILPVVVKVAVILCNVDMFEKCGVPLPETGWTWQDFLEVVQELTRPADDLYGFYLSCYGHTYPSYVWQHGGKLFSEDGCRSLIDSPQGLAAACLIQELGACSPPGVGSHISDVVEGYRHFAAGRVAMMHRTVWPSLECEALLENVRWKAVPVPRGDTEVFCRHVRGFALRRQSPAPELAGEFFRVVGQMDRWAYARGYRSGLPLHAEHARNDELEAAFRWMAHRSRDLISDIAPECRTRAHEQAYRLLIPALERVVMSREPIIEIMRHAKASMDALLSDDDPMP